jgi:hypothetical protein
MKKKGLLLAGVVVIFSCVRTTWPPPAPVEDDQSIVFPRLLGTTVVEVGAGTAPSELEGVVLKAIMIAMNDYVRPQGREPICWGSPEAHRYRVLRRGNIIFVRVDEDLEACGLQYIAVDSGAVYAISTDGRILRRYFDGGPNKFIEMEEPDAGTQEDALPSVQQDGGVAPANPIPPDVLQSGLDGGSLNPP